MAPIVSPRLLSQILMCDYAPEMCTAQYVKIAAVKSRAQLVTFPNLKVLIIGSTASRQVRPLYPIPSEDAYIPPPKVNPIPNSEEVVPDVEIDASKIAAVETLTPASIVPVVDEDTTLVQEAVAAPTSLAAAVAERNSLSTLDSTAVFSLNSIPASYNAPSTAASSIPPWVEEIFQDPAEKFGAPSFTYIRSRPSPVDSLHIARRRRASEVAATGSSPFISRPRKVSDTRGLKLFGLRGLQLLKKVKW